MLEKIVKSLVLSHLHELEEFGSRVKKFSVNFAVCNENGELALLCDCGKVTSSEEQLSQISLQILNQNITQSCDKTGSDVYRFGERNQILATVLKWGIKTVGVVLIDAGEASGTNASKNTVQTNSEYLSEMLALLAEKFQETVKAEEQIEMVSTELAQTYEELVLLHKLNTNMKVTESDANFLQMTCDSLTEIVAVEGIAILLEKVVENEKQMILTAGSGVLDVDREMITILYNRLMEEIGKGKEALLDSEVDSPFKYNWPSGIRNIMVVPLFGKGGNVTSFTEKVCGENHIIGLMAAVNRIDKSDFDTTDVKLFSSVANSCAVFVENDRLFKDLNELFIGLLRALTRSIDAKDRYTHGHSERVAFISRWIAEKLAEENLLEEEQIHKIYLAGLLHDIGKIGIDEAVLRKRGGLTEDELKCIKMHPSIGAGILSGIKQMGDIVTGVLCHHERVDGKGYPNGLAGNEVSLMGKIVGVADSFDAMTSKRNYREAMSAEQALNEIRKGLGTQFDEKVGEIFIESDIYRLLDIMQGGSNEIDRRNDFSKYGTIAVGTLIK